MRYYILNKPSFLGMGSNVDEYLMSEEEICAKWDKKEIEKMLAESSTYSEYHDLVPVPDETPVSEERIHLERVVFHIWNQWGFTRDIIVGEADFTKRIVDLTKCDGVCRFDDCDYVEFTSFSFKNVLEQHYFIDSKIEDLLVSTANRKARCEKGLKGIKSGQGYIDDYIDVEKDQYERWIKEDIAILDKFSGPIDVEDDYLSHLYEGRLGYWEEEMQRDMEELKRNDYRKFAFNYPIGPEMRGEYTHHYDDRRYYALDEIFTHGADVKSKYFAFTDTADDLKELEGIDVMSTLRDVFGYD